MKIIHLSDFHLDGETLYLEHKRLLDALITDIDKYYEEDCILVFSGDFLNVGGKNIHSQNNPFVIFKENVLDCIYTSYPLLKDRTFFVAGNHDINRDSINTSDKLAKKQLLKEYEQRDNIYDDFQKYLPGFKEYNTFVSDFYRDFKEEKNITFLESNFIIKTKDGNKIGITSLNSSFLCYDSDDLGNILLLDKQLRNSIEFIDECDVKIAVLHHPIDFFHETEKEKIQKILEKEYDLVFVGHTHKVKQEFKQTLNGICFFSNGKSLNGEEPEITDYINGYTIIDYIPNQTLKVHLRNYSNICNKFVPNNEYGNDEGIYEVSINKNIDNEKEKTLEISDDFKIFLNDAGVDFTHKYREKVTLKDIYIFPNLESFNTPDSSEEEIKTTIKSQELLNNINNFKPNRIVILGDKSSGKTSFCKVCFQKIFEKENFYPIFIQGEEIKDLKRIEKLKNRLLNEQYSSSKIPTSKNTFLIIDDFNNTKIKPKYLKNFLKDLIESNFSFILIWDEYLTLNDIFDSLISKIDVYEILPFGRKDRYDLMRKWLDLNDIGKEAV